MPKNKKKDSKEEVSKRLALDVYEDRRNDLIKKIMQLKGAYQKEIEYKKEFEKKMEYVSNFREIKKKKMKETRKRRKHLEFTLGLINDQHQLELNKYKEKIKLLLHQQFNQFSERKLGSSILFKNIEDQNDTQKRCWYEEKHVQKQFLGQQQWSHHEQTLQLRLEKNKCLTAIRGEFQFQSSEMTKHTENQLKEIREAMGIRMRGNEVPTLFDSDVPAQVIDRHDSEMLQVRRVLNDKAHDNLDRLETLEKKLKLLIRLKIMSDKTLKQLRLENNDIREPLSRAQSNVTLFEEKLDQSRKLKEDLQRNQQVLRTLSKRVEESLWQYEVLYQDYKSLEVEDDRRRQKLENDAINFYGECNIYS